MADRLFEIYDQELAILRNQASEFGDLYPKIASELRLGASKFEDPHIAFLIESIAFLNSRLRLKIEDDFPQICETLLNVLYPHYLAPIPSMSMVQFQCKGDVTPAPEGVKVPRFSKIETSPIQGVPCTFQTTREIKVWPCKLIEAVFHRPPYPTGLLLPDNSCNSILVLTLESPKIAFSEYLDFNLTLTWSGPLNLGQTLISMILHQTKSLWCTSASGSVRMDTSRISQDLYGNNSSLLPYSPRTFLGYRLLTEYFAFPEKFLSFDINLNNLQMGLGNQISLIFGFENLPAGNLERLVSKENIKTGCVPVVNLFSKRTEPRSLAENSREYCIIPEARHPKSFFIHSLEEVRIVDSSGASREVPEIFGFSPNSGETGFSWSSLRKIPGTGDDGHFDAPQVFLQLDNHEKIVLEKGSVLDVKVACTNGNLPTVLPFGAGEPRLTLVDSPPSVEAPVMIMPPSRPCYGHLFDRPSFRWKLVSHLLINHISLCNESEAVGALKKMLQIYNFSEAATNDKLIESIAGLKQTPAISKSPLGGGIIQGTEITVEFKNDIADSQSILQFGSILDRFFSVYVDAFSFSRLVVKYAGTNTILFRWPARVGECSSI